MVYDDRYQPPLLDESETARILGVSIRTLQAWRCDGAGPAFIKLGRSVRYDRGTLTQWLAAQTFASTSAHTMAG